MALANQRDFVGVGMGQPAFPGTTTHVLYQVVHRNPVRPRDLVPSIPFELEIVLALALAKDPAARFASALELAAALRAALVGHVAAPLRARAAAILRQTPWSSRPT